mmetsp:Transcript_94909/g.245063  ORF Transcript_94909/g.245063 Transcript_94909/m.245063 type:complete len:98 (-) Transcript_94909:49-342(-)
MQSSRWGGLFRKARPDIFVHIKDSSLMEMAAETKAASILQEASKRKPEGEHARHEGLGGADGPAVPSPAAKARMVLTPKKPQQPNTPPPSSESAAPA